MRNYYLYLPLLLLLTTNQLVYAGSKHVQELDQLIISTPLSQSTANTALPVSILSGDELRMKASSSIGETLKNEPGITSQSFGPGVGQPVIRGQSGSRVHVLQNGLGSLDVSSLSPDHSNSTEALWAERIEVLRGPATLLYGSGAIGGVVNVLDNRIPDTVPDT
ncbi:MAG: TonB-dependent receptor plug domain-containing protein, partial [Methylococcaceae bacterium]|nr:TonB-dependent receptor plug domain-containing protein [Methylococcaceae bacterium]